MIFIPKNRKSLQRKRRFE